MDHKNPAAAEQFRSSLEDAAAVIERLLPYCVTAKDLFGMLTLALENEGQMKLLLDAVRPKK